jgi:hypothetical protein
MCGRCDLRPPVIQAYWPRAAELPSSQPVRARRWQPHDTRCKLVYVDGANVSSRRRGEGSICDMVCGLQRSEIRATKCGRMIQPTDVARSVRWDRPSLKLCRTFGRRTRLQLARSTSETLRCALAGSLSSTHKTAVRKRARSWQRPQADRICLEWTTLSVATRAVPQLIHLRLRDLDSLPVSL